MAELPPIDQHLEKEHQEKTKVKNIQCVEMGKFEVSTLLLTGPLMVPHPDAPAQCCRDCSAPGNALCIAQPVMFNTRL